MIRSLPVAVALTFALGVAAVGLAASSPLLSQGDENNFREQPEAYGDLLTELRRFHSDEFSGAEIDAETGELTVLFRGEPTPEAARRIREKVPSAVVRTTATASRALLERILDESMEALLESYPEETTSGALEAELGYATVWTSVPEVTARRVIEDLGHAEHVRLHDISDSTLYPSTGP